MRSLMMIEKKAMKTSVIGSRSHARVSFVGVQWKYAEQGPKRIKPINATKKGTASCA